MPVFLSLSTHNARTAIHSTQLTQEGEFEKSGGEEWDGKEGWELSEERLEKLRGRLASLRVLKLERATEMVGLVVDCQKLFRELSPPVEHPLQHKVHASYRARKSAASVTSYM